LITALISGSDLPPTWHELYLMLGTSTAALVGLLFVAASLHLAEIANEGIYRLRSQFTTLILLSTLLEATAVLVPQSMPVLGIELLAVNLWGLSFPLTLLSKVVSMPRARRGGFSLRRAAIFIAGYIAGIVGAGVLVSGREWGMYLVTASYSILLMVSIWNGWMILQGIGQGERFRKTLRKRTPRA
jgi:hypothetical protein